MPDAKWRWVWILPLPWLALAATSIVSARDDRTVAQRARSAHALVVAYHPEDHAGYDVRIVVNRKWFTGRAYPADTGLRVGQDVLVFFDPKSPTRMSLAGFSKDAEREFLGVPLLTVGMIWIVAFVIRARRQVRHAAV